MIKLRESADPAIVEGVGQSERGLLTTELAILMPIVLVISLIAVFAVNVERHNSRAQQAADAAARAASLKRTPDEARGAAQDAAESVCGGAVVIDQVKFVAPDLASYTPGLVFVALSCSEPFSGFEPLVQSQIRTERGVAVAAIEYWRGQ